MTPLCASEISYIDVEIRDRRSAEGHPFGEVFHTVHLQGGEVRRFYSRHGHPVSDTPQSRAHYLAAFRLRQGLC